MQDRSNVNKQVFITGATSGIGKSCALYYLNSGAKVIMCGKDIETLKAIGSKFPEQAAVVKLDLVKDLNEKNIVDTVKKICDGLDIVINCAGIIFDGDIEKTFAKDYDYLVDLNLRASFILIKSLVNNEVLKKDGGSIVNVSCLYGTKSQQGIIGHCMTKRALEMLTRYAAAEFAPSGIRVNGVTACPVDTNSQRYVGITEPEYSQFKEKMSRNIPLGRMATPDEVAKAITFLASGKAGKITGNILKVDGGRSLTSSGYFPWRGSKEMNARFEPDGLNNNVVFNKMWNKITGKKDPEIVFPLNNDQIDALISESNWATRLSEAHEKVQANYKNIEQNTEYLKQNFVNKDK